jgi:glycerate kinase
LLEAAEAIPLDPERLDPFPASSRGLGELIRAVGQARGLQICLGGTANVDGGAGLLEVLDELPAPTRVACDVDVPLLDAARVFAAQKGATPEDARELEMKLLAMEELAPFATPERAGGLRGSRRSGGAAAGARPISSASDPGLRPVVTGEGTVARRERQGAPGEGSRGALAALFGGQYRGSCRSRDGRAVRRSDVPDDRRLGMDAAGTF